MVNDEAITQYDLDDARSVVLKQLKQQNVQQPSADVLDKQVLERLITERALLQYAKENGVKVDDTTVERTIQRIAEDNKITTRRPAQGAGQGQHPICQVPRGRAQRNRRAATARA